MVRNPKDAPRICGFREELRLNPWALIWIRIILWPLEKAWFHVSEGWEKGSEHACTIKAQSRRWHSRGVSLLSHPTPTIILPIPITGQNLIYLISFFKINKITFILIRTAYLYVYMILVLPSPIDIFPVNGKTQSHND